MRKRFGILKSVSVVLLACSALPLAAQQESTIGSDKQSDETKSIDLFYAMEQRQVEVKFVARGSEAANVIVTNLTKKPIEVQLPGTFAGVPILGKAQPKQIGFGQAGRPPVLGQIGFGQFGGGAPIGGGQFGGGQFGGGGQLGQFGGGQQGGGGGQALGGGFNQNQGGGGGIGLGNGVGNGFGLQNGGRGNGLFRIEMDRPLKISVQTVCLEHGKPDPNPRMKYQLIPLANFTASPEIEVLCRQLSSGNASQKVAQAAAWNIANGLTWEKLSAKNRRESQYTGNERFFTQKELEQAMKFTAHCRSLTEQYVSTSSK